jgi:hypothetical protein
LKWKGKKGKKSGFFIYHSMLGGLAVSTRIDVIGKKFHQTILEKHIVFEKIESKDLIVNIRVVKKDFFLYN